jgi:hypothetical protein
MSTIEVNKVTPVSGGTNLQIGESGDTTNLSAGSVTLPTSIITGATEKTTLVDADKFLLSDSAASGAFKYVTKANLGGGTNTPNFLARMTSTQNVGGETTVIFNSEDFDTANAYNTSTGEFTVPSSGKYYFTTVCTNSASYGGMYLNIRKAGTHVIRGTSFNANAGSASANGIVNCTANEVVVVRLENGTQQNMSTSAGHTFFGGFKLIE